MNGIILNQEQLVWLGTYGRTIVINDTGGYQVLGIDNKPLGACNYSISGAVFNAMKEHDTSFEDIIEESGIALYLQLRQAFDEYAGHELSGQECLQLLKDLKK